MAEQDLLLDAFSMVRHNRHRKLKVFLEKHLDELDIDTADDKGNTMLCVACQNGLKRMAKIILKNYANIDVQNNLGNTPLHFCFQYGFAELGAYLITKGANVDIRNNRGALCTDGLGLRDMKLFQDAKAEREKIENGNSQAGFDYDDGVSSVGNLTDRSCIGGMYTDRTGAATDRSSGMYTERHIAAGYNTDRPYTIEESDGEYNPYCITEGIAEEDPCEETEQQYSYEIEQQSFENGVYPAPPIEEASGAKVAVAKKTWRPLPMQPKPRPLPKGPRPLPPGPRPVEANDDRLPSIVPMEGTQKNNVGVSTKSTVVPLPLIETVAIQDNVSPSETPSSNPAAETIGNGISFKFNTLAQAVQAKDYTEIDSMVPIASIQDVDAAIQVCSVVGGAQALPLLLPMCSLPVLFRSVGTAASNNRLRTLKGFLEYIVDAKREQSSAPNNNTAISQPEKSCTAVIDMPEAQTAIDRALARAAANGRSTACSLLAGYACSKAIVEALCVGAHHKHAKVVKRLLPWGESKSLDLLIGSASSSGDADIMILLLPYISTNCDVSIIDQCIESACAKGHIAIVGILWRFASNVAQERAVPIAKHHNQNELLQELLSKEGVFA